MVIRTPPQHNTSNPPGQFGYEKLQDGCCHKTVLYRCLDCSYPTKGRYLRDIIQRIEGEEGVKPPTPQLNSERRWNRLDGALAGLRHAYAQLIAGKVVDQAAFARGLIGPAIYEIEKINNGKW